MILERIEILMPTRIIRGIEVNAYENYHFAEQLPDASILNGSHSNSN